MRNDGDTAYFTPVYYYEGNPLISISDVYELFHGLLDSGEQLSVEFKNNPMTDFLTVESVHERYATLYSVANSGDKVRTTIPYYDVLSYQVLVEGAGGRLREWQKTYKVPELGTRI